MKTDRPSLVEALSGVRLPEPLYFYDLVGRAFNWLADKMDALNDYLTRSGGG